MEPLVLPDGSTFDFAVGLPQDLGDPAERGFPKSEEFLAETHARLETYGLRPSPAPMHGAIHAEVGDDEIDVSTNPTFAAAELAVYTLLLGVKVSESDTSINPRFGNFAEDLVVLPDGYEQTYHYARQTSWAKDMAFIDVPKLRLAIDIRPGRMQHSSTNDGKAGMLGSRLAWLPRQSPVRCLWEVFNLFQDLNLGLLRDEKFAYLPTALGGYGKPVPFGLASNFEAFALRYKQGKHAPLARELVRRTNKRFREYTAENEISIDPVLNAVARIQSSWHDWIKGKSLYAPTCWLEAPPEVLPYRVAKHGNNVILDHAMRRLEAEGLLVSESDLAIAYEHNLLCKQLVSATEHNEFLEAREAARKQWLNLSTFSMRLYGMLEPLGVDQSMHHTLSSDEYSEFASNLTSRRLNLRNFLRQEYFFTKEAKDLIYMRGPMKVMLSMMPRVTKAGRRFWYEQTKDLPHGFDEKPELEKLLSWVKNPDRELVPPTKVLTEDDPIILQEIRSLGPKTAVALVTDDRKLCLEAHKSTGKWICQVPPKWYYIAMYFGDDPQPWMDILGKKYPFYEWVTIEDSGSIESWEELGFRDGNPLSEPVFRPFSMVKPSILPDGRRLRSAPTEMKVEDYAWEPTRFPDGYLFTHRRLVGARWRPHRGLA